MKKEESKPPHWLEVRLKIARMKKGDLAEAMGFGNARITGIINGTRKIKSHEVPKMAKALKMPAPELLALITGEAYAPIGPDQTPETDAEGQAFKLIDVVADLRSLTPDERLALFRKFVPVIQAMLPPKKP